MEFGQISTAFCKDLHDQRLAWIKVIFFFLSGGTTCLYPFLPLYMKSLGLRLNEAAIILCLTPIFSMIGTYLAGRLVAKITNVKAVLTGLTAISAVFPLLFLAVPYARTERLLPSFGITLTVFCGITSHQNLLLEPVPPVPAHSCHLPWGVGTVREVKVGVCGHMCRKLPTSRFALVDQIPQDDLLIKAQSIDLKTRFFLPGSLQPTWDCDLSGHDHKNKCEQSIDKLLTNARRYYNITIHVVTHPHLTDYTLIAVNGTSGRESPMSDIWRLCQDPRNFHKNDTLLARIHQEYDCEHHCVASTRSDDLCINRSEIFDAKIRLAFWLIMTIKYLNTILASMVFSLLEASVIAFIKETGGGAEVSRQKNFGVFGKVILPVAVGFLVDVFSSPGHINFICLFLTFTLLKLVAAGCVWMSPLSVISEIQVPLKNLLPILQNIELDVLLCTTFACGVFSGFLGHYLFWHLEDLGARIWLMTLALSLAALCSLPFIVFAEPMVKHLGTGNLVSAGILFAGVKLLAYSFIRSPELCLLIELCEPLVGPLYIASVLRYGRNISNKPSVDTTSLLTAVAYYGLGQGVCAALLGGYMTLDLQFPQTAQILGGTAVACAVIYYAFWHCCFKYVRQVVPQQPSQRSQRSRWGSVRYLSFRKNRLRRAVNSQSPPTSPDTPDVRTPPLNSITEDVTQA